MHENDEDGCDPRHPADKTPQTKAEEPNQTTPPSWRSSRNDDNNGSTSTTSLQVKLFHEISKPIRSSLHKVSIVGTGAVGMACAFSILTKNLTGELALKDLHEERVRGEMMDLQHGAAFIKSARIIAGDDPKVTANSRIIIITAGVRQKEGENRLSLLQKNLDIFKPLVPALVSLSPDAVIIVVSNPVDILTYFTWKLSGLPQGKVIGAGTNLDTSRFRFLISQKLNVAVESCHGWIIGEHGDSSVPVWSGVNIAGIPIKEMYPALGTDNDPDNWQEIHKKVVHSAYDIIKLKGYTSWGIGLSVSNLVETILRNSHRIHAVSTNVQGVHGINEEVYLSVPCVLGESGVTHIVKQQLTKRELEKLHKSADILKQNIDKLNS